MGLSSALRRWDIVENERDSAILPFIHHAVGFLIIDFIGLTYLQLIGPSINHESDSWIRGDGYMNPVTCMKRRMLVYMWFDHLA